MTPVDRAFAYLLRRSAKPLILVDNWGTKLWRLWSVRIIAMAAALQLELALFPNALKAFLPDKTMHGITVALLLIGAYARVVKQEIPQRGHKNG